MAHKIRSRAVLAISLGVVGCGMTDPKSDKPAGAATWPLVPGINLVPDNPTCATYGSSPTTAARSARATARSEQRRDVAAVA